MVRLISIIVFFNLIYALANNAPAFAAEHKINETVRASLTYEGRASLIDIGDGAGRQGISNTLWADISKRDSSAEIFMRGRVQNFEGDSYTKQYNAIPENTQFALNEAYIRKAAPASALQFGLFHFEPLEQRFLDLRNFNYGFDPMNRPKDKKGQGNFLYERFLKSAGAELFANYQFGVDYSNSMKIIGGKYKQIRLFHAFSDSRRVTCADVEKQAGDKMTLAFSLRNNGFKYLDPIDQMSAAAKLDLAKILKGGAALAAKKSELSYNAEFLVNRTANNYFLLARNLSDTAASGVLFPYQKSVAAHGITMRFKNILNTGVAIRHYCALTPLFTKADGLREEMPQMQIILAVFTSSYRGLDFETSFLKGYKNDNSNMLTERTNFRTLVRYPF